MSAFQAEVLNTLGWPTPEAYARLTPLARRCQPQAVCHPVGELPA
jgi:hypothetical protein